MRKSLELEQISVLDLPEYAVEFFEFKRAGSDGGYNTLYRVADDNFTSYIGDYPFVQKSGELDRYLHIVDYIDDGTEAGMAEACFVTDPSMRDAGYEEVYRDKPYIRWTKTENEYAGKHGLGKRRLTALNLATRALFDRPLNSSWLVSRSAQRTWESLIRDDQAIRYTEPLPEGLTVERFRFID